VQGNGREQGATEEDGWLSKQATGNAEESAEEHSLVPLPQKKCQFFLRGRCKLGAKCKRAHVPNRALCRNFLAGKCRKEAKCKYTHSEEARKEYTAELALEETQQRNSLSSERQLSSVGQLVEEPAEGPLPTESVTENLAVIIDEKTDTPGEDGKATQLEEKVSENLPSNAGIEYKSGHPEVTTDCAEETDSNPIKDLRPTKSGKSEGQEVQGNGREQGATEEDGWLSKQATGNAEESAEEHSLVPLPQKKCQFFLRGRCKLGAKCKRAHVPNRALCRNFLAGKCRKEAKCKYTHSEEARKEYTAELALEESQQRNSLLKKLLRRERDLEASLTLQAIKYIVENNFFE